MYSRRRSRNPWQALAAFLLTIAVIIIWAVTLENGHPTTSVVTNSAAAGDVRSYFPAQPGLTWHYAGEGAEYASFSRKVADVEGSMVLIEETTTATTVGAVYSISKERAALLVSEEEHTPGEHALFAEAAANAAPKQIPIQQPVAVGSRWQDSVGKREITARLADMSVPAGTFYDVVVVKTVPAAESEYEITEYYAPNVGLIRRDFAPRSGASGHTVSSFLSAYGYDPQSGLGPDGAAE